ncbi:MAG TPA: GAF domain-containing protein [Armatimonadetes bacterium]|nr:GAF domain-containing protein [Armatimonadota bacterium]
MSGKSTEDLLAKRERELSLLQRVTERIWSTLDLDQVLMEAVSVITEFTDADACFIYLYEPETNQLVLKAAHRELPPGSQVTLKLGEGITGWVAQQRESVAIPKGAYADPRFKMFNLFPEERYEALLSVPLVHRDELVGIVNVRHRNQREYSQDEIALVEMVAHQVGGAIANAMLYEETKRRAMTIEALSEISSAIVSDRYIEEILGLIASLTAKIMNSRISSLMLLDNSRNELVIKATQSLSEAYRSKPPIKVHQSVSGKAVIHKRPIFVLDVRREEDFAYKDIAEREGLCSLLSVPMMIRDRVIGVLNIYPAEPHYFTPEEVRVAQAVANQAALAIESVRLWEEAQKTREELETRKLVERAKGVLMDKFGLTESQAHRKLQKLSMDRGMPVKRIAEIVLLSAELEEEVE